MENFSEKIFYVCLFSTKKDDLNQWRSYASSENGVAIVFDKNIMQNKLANFFIDTHSVIYENKEKKLEIISSMPKEDIFINADSRYMYRIIENLFSNISKYALDSSRVYIDVKNDGLKVKIAIKNISKDKLNISAEELIQRFVRGDKSRTTEGSGLGLSISQSLTELQKGKFVLNVDGDLFKVELEFDIVK